MRRTTTPGAARAGRDPVEGCPTREPLPTRVQGLPALPPEYEATLDAGLAALGLGLPTHVRAALDGHVRLLLAWARAINLTAIRDPVAVAREHILDSLSGLPILHRHGAARLLDLGSGAGFPGLPLALALPARRTLLVDSVGKKASFMQTAVDALGLEERITVAATRAETLGADPQHRGRWQAVTARAVAELAELVELALPLLVRDGLLLAWKRQPIETELDRAGSALHVLGGEVVEVAPVALPGLTDHCLVAVVKVSETPPGFPRDPAVRRRHPW